MILEAAALTGKFFPRAILLAVLTLRELDASRYFFRDRQAFELSWELRGPQLNSLFACWYDSKSIPVPRMTSANDVDGLIR